MHDVKYNGRTWAIISTVVCRLEGLLYDAERGLFAITLGFL